MIKKIVLSLILCLIATGIYAQNNTTKRDHKKNLVVKEWNLKAGNKTPRLDNVVTFDALGRKTEEIEYASYGQKERKVYEYSGNSVLCTRVVEYDDKNHVKKIKIFEYNEDGTKAKQYSYKPNGKLESTKTFEYSYK